MTVTEPGGRVYPLSNAANSVVDVLRFALARPNITLRAGEAVDGRAPAGARLRHRDGA